MKDRINQLMKSQHMTQQTFADFIGISTASLSSIFNGRTKPTLNTVEAIRGKFPTISLDWLMYGTGSMFNDSEPTNSDFTDGGAMADGGNFFEGETTPSLPFDNVEPLQQYTSAAPKQMVKTEVKYIDRPQSNITEIRIFFDDQTWESFVPKK